jgi:hypothetical protein
MRLNLLIPALLVATTAAALAQPAAPVRDVTDT